RGTLAGAATARARGSRMSPPPSTADRRRDAGGIRGWLLVVLACVGVAVVLGFIKYRQIEAAIAFGASFPEPMETVEIARVLSATAQSATAVTGEVVATRSISLVNELPGRIVTVGFAGGDRVAAGKTLLQLDDSEESAALTAAAAEAELARLDLARSERLLPTGATARESFERNRARAAAAAAEVDRLRAIVAKKRLLAPFAARTDLHQWAVGQYVERGTVIARLVDVDEGVWVDFALPQEQAGLAVGATIRFSASGVVHAADVIARDAMIDAQSRNVRYRALAAPAADLPDPGALVSVQVPLGAPVAAVMVPINAVRRTAFGAHVFLLEDAEPGTRGQWRARQQAVTLGNQSGDQIVVLEGLEPGQRIAGNGAFKLREGVLVAARSVTDAGAAE
ncbi:MAG: efflux RND transporter periplasmic adaptor subunit, partial [Gammaproteobacteria bacterium]